MTLEAVVAIRCSGNMQAHQSAFQQHQAQIVEQMAVRHNWRTREDVRAAIARHEKKAFQTHSQLTQLGPLGILACQPLFCQFLGPLPKGFSFILPLRPESPGRQGAGQQPANQPAPPAPPSCPGMPTKQGLSPARPASQASVPETSTFKW